MEHPNTRVGEAKRRRRENSYCFFKRRVNICIYQCIMARDIQKKKRKVMKHPNTFVRDPKRLRSIRLRNICKG